MMAGDDYAVAAELAKRADATAAARGLYDFLRNVGLLGWPDPRGGGTSAFDLVAFPAGAGAMAELAASALTPRQQQEFAERVSGAVEDRLNHAALALVSAARLIGQPPEIIAPEAVVLVAATLPGAKDDAGEQPPAG
jgi:hypothetical protein